MNGILYCVKIEAIFSSPFEAGPIHPQEKAFPLFKSVEDLKTLFFDSHPQIHSHITLPSSALKPVGLIAVNKPNC